MSIRVVRERVGEGMGMMAQIVAQLVAVVALSHSRRILRHGKRKTWSHISKARHAAHTARTSVLSETSTSVTEPDLGKERIKEIRTLIYLPSTDKHDELNYPYLDPGLG